MQFKTNASLNVRTVVLVLFAFAFMVLDQHYHALTGMRSVMSFVLSPMRYVVSAPTNLYHWMGENLAARSSLIAENSELRSESLLLHAELQQLSELKDENKQLKALLSSSTQVAGKMVVAQLQALAFAPFTQQVMVNKGERDGVYVGQPVVDAFGVMGQVIDVGVSHSRVLLISDARSAVPVVNRRNGRRAIVAGQGYPDLLQVLYVPDTADFKSGDELVTSGLGQRYPASYPVGKIIDVQSIKGESFARITVMPDAQLDRAHLVLLVWPHGEDKS